MTTAARSQTLPQLPTIGDFVPGYEASVAFGLCAPKQTPAEIIERLNSELNAGLADPAIATRLREMGSVALSLGAAGFLVLRAQHGAHRMEVEHATPDASSDADEAAPHATVLSPFPPPSDSPGAIPQPLLLGSSKSFVFAERELDDSDSRAGEPEHAAPADPREGIDPAMLLPASKVQPEPPRLAPLFSRENVHLYSSKSLVPFVPAESANGAIEADAGDLVAPGIDGADAVARTGLDDLQEIALLPDGRRVQRQPAVIGGEIAHHASMPRVARKAFMRCVASSGLASRPALSAKRNSSAKCKVERALSCPPTMVK